MSDLQLSSPAFGDGERIPEAYGYTERNVNPPLTVSGVPAAAESLALIVDDPDAREPAGKVWDHWLVWDVPPDVTEIPEDWSAETPARPRDRTTTANTATAGRTRRTGNTPTSSGCTRSTRRSGCRRPRTRATCRTR